MKLHFKVFAIVMGIISAMLLFTMATSVFVISRGLEKTVDGQLSVIAHLAEEFISSEMEIINLQTDDIVEHLMGQPEGDWPAVLQDNLSKYNFLLGLSVISRTGEQLKAGVANPPDNFRNSKCVAKARGGTGTFSTSAINDNTMLVFYFCVPLGERQVLVATIQGLYFAQLLKHYKIWESGSIFIVDGDGTYVSSERMKDVLNRYNPLEDGSEEAGSLRGFVGRMVNDTAGNGLGHYLWGGKENQAVYRAISAKNVDWILGVYAPIPESPGGHLYKGLIAMSFIFLAFGALSALFLSSFISKQFRTINEQNKHLAELNQVAKDASETKTNFLANMSHEMRTPLNAVVGFSELMLNGISRPEDQEENLQKIHTAGVTLLGIVNDILDISKIESGKFELVPVDYEIASLINDTVTVNMIRIGEKNINFKLSVDPDLPYRLHGDELRIKQICNNFLSNAFKYTKEGEVELSVSSAVNGEDVWLILSVRDSGIGIKKEDIVKLFSAYNQVDTKSNRLIEGTGLGLSIAKRMAQMMEGTIDVESDYGVGSTFTATVRQRFVTDRTIGREIADQLEGFSFQRKKSTLVSEMAISKMPYARVLIVDDVQTNLDVARGMLKPYEMKIDCVTSGIQAVNIIRDHEIHYDAIFMDHMMPQMDGIEAVSIIRNQLGTEYAKKIPVIALTANAIIGNDKIFLQNGFQAYLSKPMDMKEVDKVLNALVRDKDKEREFGLSGGPAPAAQGGPPGQAEGATLVPAPRAPGQDGQNGQNGAPPGGVPAIPGVDVAAGVSRFGGDEGVFLETLGSFAGNSLALLDQVRDPREGGLKDYMIVVHGIKSSCYGVCATEVGRLAEALENAAMGSDMGFIKDNNPGFIGAVEALAAGIRKALGEGGGACGPPKNIRERPDPGLIDSLLKACESYDMDGIDLAIEELDKHSYQSDPNLVQWIKERAETMEFNRISEKFQSG